MYVNVHMGFFRMVADRQNAWGSNARASVSAHRGGRK